MHTQEKHIRRRRGGWQIDLGGLVGLGLYGITMVVEALLGGAARWYGAFVVVTVGQALLSLFGLVELSLDASAVAWGFAALPLALSLLGLAVPGSGAVWAWRKEARRLTEAEGRRFDEAMDELRREVPALADPRRVYVVEDVRVSAQWRGRVLLLSSGALDCMELPAMIAHELGHGETLDGRILEGLGRVILWEDVLGVSDSELREAGYADYDVDPAGGLVWGVLRWWLRLAGGSFAVWLMRPFWAAHWRAREYRADRFAVELGQGENLVTFLEEHKLAFESRYRYRFPSLADHPPVALRMERLEKLVNGEAPGQRRVALRSLLGRGGK